MIADRKSLAPLLAATLLMGGAGIPRLWGAEEPSVVVAEAGAIPLPSREKLDGLVTTLGADDYRTRMGAQSELMALATEHAAIVSEALVGAYLEAKDVDLRARLRLTLWNAKRNELQDRPIGFVGIQMLDSVRQGNDANGGLRRTVQVVRVIEGTAAEKNDLRIGDEIVGMDGKEFDRAESPSVAYQEHISSRTVGDTVDLKILRGPQELTVKVRLGERPPMDMLGLGSDEKDQLNSAFNAFIRDSAEKRGLAVPGSETPPVDRPDGVDEAPLKP